MASTRLVNDLFALDPIILNGGNAKANCAASTPVNATLVDGYGQAVLSLGTVGDQTLTVADMTDGAIQGMTSDPIPVIPSAAHHFLIDPMPVSVIAGDLVSVSIRAVDAGDNTLLDYAGDAVLSANTGSGSITPVCTFKKPS